MQDTLEVNALSRPCELGQLYDSRNGQFLPGLFLFRSDVIQPCVAVAKSTKAAILEVKNFSDRAATLDVSASLSLSILCGMVTVNGTASYLSASQDTAESATLAAVAKFRTCTKSFDILELMDNTSITPEKAALELNATHVVTSITYGGNVVATVASKSSHNEKEDKVSGGKLSLGIMEGFKALFSAGASASLNSLEREKLTSSNLEVILEADIRLGEEDEIPTDPLAMIQLVKRSHTLVGEGVPCEVRLVPLQKLGHCLLTFRELAEADLNSFRDTYDRIFVLDNNRRWLRDAAETQRAFFPTFAASASTRSVGVTGLVHAARDHLRRYMHRYRSADVTVEEPADFIERTEARFADVTREYMEDREIWRMLQARLSIAEDRELPFIQVCDIPHKMSRVGLHRSVIAMVLVPEEVQWAAMVNLYGDLAVEIRKWRQSVEESAAREARTANAVGITEWISVYLDALCDKALLRLDDQVGTVKKAVQLARTKHEPTFLTYGRSQGHLGGFNWHIMDQDGPWGVITDSWRYIGEIRNSKPHGTGIATYVDGTQHHGSFFFGLPGGPGKILGRDGQELEAGVFYHGKHNSRAIVVEVTAVNQDEVPLQHEVVTLCRGDSLASYVSQISRAMGWSYKQRARIVFGGGKEIAVVGDMIDSCEDMLVQRETRALVNSLTGKSVKIIARLQK
ncbi:hypothetical protein B0H16DRAFT_1586845 [Mycena metata]|uniref:SNTX MACPF/CDC-like domain-containing protein n=1 Tax=Mycena metata TaxID=1033252 RepID=A0AAD7HXF3_9AGAR|nr:hypothetical protein B0H16DRAFT_1586845 [Mycena metata]